jgi:hypothetical protein
MSVSHLLENVNPLQTISNSVESVVGQESLRLGAAHIIDTTLYDLGVDPPPQNVTHRESDVHTHASLLR